MTKELLPRLRDCGRRPLTRLCGRASPGALRRRRVCALAGRKRRRPAAISQGEDRAAAARHRWKQAWQAIRMSRPVANQT
jgi:hypothetical protein